MGKIKNLASVAYGLCDHFLSLSNRTNGYWTLGVLYKKALRANTKAILLELFKKTTEPRSINAKETINHSRDFLFILLEKHHLEITCLKRAYIYIEFDVEPSGFDLSLVSEFGNPLNCAVVLVDSNEKKYVCKIRDRCMEYDKGNFSQNFHYGAYKKSNCLQRFIRYLKDRNS